MNQLYRMWDNNTLIPKFLTGYSPCLQVLSTYNNKEAKKSFLETQIDAMTFRTVHCLESTFSGQQRMVILSPYPEARNFCSHHRYGVQ